MLFIQYKFSASNTQHFYDMYLMWWTLTYPYLDLKNLHNWSPGYIYCLIIVFFGTASLFTWFSHILIQEYKLCTNIGETPNAFKFSLLYRLWRRKCLRISELHVIVQIVNNEISNWKIGLDQVSNTNIVHSDKKLSLD